MKGTTSVFRFPRGKNVTRDVTISAPDQGGHPVNIQALPLPRGKPSATATHANPGPNPGQEKGNDFYIWIINPKVSDAVTGAVLTSFTPALRLTVVYLPEDEKKSNGRLSLCLCYQRQDKSWKYRIIRTRQDKTKKTLSSTIENLDPNDPVGAGVP